MSQVQCPRLSYLPFLLHRLHNFFATSLIDTEARPYDGWFSFEGVPLKWQYPVGLLYDLFSGRTPYSASPTSNGQLSSNEGDSHHSWRLELHFGNWPDQVLVQPDAEGKTIRDVFMNSVKEADFLRNGSARSVMSLSKDDSEKLWRAVKERMRD